MIIDKTNIQWCELLWFWPCCPHSACQRDQADAVQSPPPLSKENCSGCSQLFRLSENLSEVQPTILVRAQQNPDNSLQLNLKKEWRDWDIWWHSQNSIQLILHLCFPPAVTFQTYYPSNPGHGPSLLASYTWEHEADYWLSMTDDQCVQKVDSPRSRKSRRW